MESLIEIETVGVAVPQLETLLQMLTVRPVVFEIPVLLDGDIETPGLLVRVGRAVMTVAVAEPVVVVV